MKITKVNREIYLKCNLDFIYFYCRSFILAIIETQVYSTVLMPAKNNLFIDIFLFKYLTMFTYIHKNPHGMNYYQHIFVYYIVFTFVFHEQFLRASKQIIR